MIREREANLFRGKTHMQDLKPHCLAINLDPWFLIFPKLDWVASRLLWFRL